MIEIIAVAVVGVMSFYSGWTARERAAQRRVDELLSNINESLEEQVQASVIKITIEHHNGVYYVYDMENSSFMAQGTTRKDLEADLAKKFPGKSFAATKENLAEMGFA
jgi:seryl-tRNA synthetase